MLVIPSFYRQCKIETKTNLKMSIDRYESFPRTREALFCLFREINRRCIRDPAIYFSYRNGRRTCSPDPEAEQNARTPKRVFSHRGQRNG